MIIFGCSHWRWWIIRPALSKPASGRFLAMKQSRHAISSRSEAPSEFCCGHLHLSPRDIALHPHLVSVALKLKLAARGKRAPRASSIVDVFFRLPSQASVVGGVAPDVCLLACEAAWVLLGVNGEEAQSDSKHAC